MKKSILVIASICILIVTPINGQKGGLLKKVANSMTNELLGKPQNNNAKEQEPQCACKDAEAVVGLGGKIQLNYSELTITTRDDGAILMKDKVSGSFYIANGGVLQGPISEGDRRLVGFGLGNNDDNSTDYWIERYGQYITKSGGKYLINFGGKTYGPYATINSFVMPRSNDKFAAMVVENLVATEDQGKKMDEAIKNAKTEQEKMELAMKFSQEMLNKMMEGGGAGSVLPKFITSVAGSTYDPMLGQRTINATMKYDEILLIAYPDIFDLKGNKVITLKPEHSGTPVLFINSGNTKYAYEIYGELSFSDGTPKLNELFNPYLMKADGIVYLAYMYYSPKNNGIMKCKIPF
jgi:hypothetical protein